MIDLTVVTVCRNANDKLAVTINSVLRQKAKGSISIEHIVIDGASTDGSLSYLRHEKDNGHIEILISEPDKGIYYAMNKGLWLAHGKVITYLNAGDWYTDNDLACCIKPIIKQEAISVAAIARFVEPQTGNVIGRRIPDYNNVYLFNNCVEQAYFIDTRYLKGLGGHDTNYKCHADTELFFKVYKETGLPHIVHEEVVNYELGGFSKDALIKYVNEMVEYKWNYLHEILEMASRNETYRTSLCFHLLLNAYSLPHATLDKETQWKACTMLKALIERTLCYTSNIKHKVALLLLAKIVLPSLAKGKPCHGILQYCKRLANAELPPIEQSMETTIRNFSQQ